MTTTTTGYFRQFTKVEKLVGNKFFWLGFVLLMFTYPIVRSVYRTLPAPLPVLYTVPQFELQNEFGKPFGSKDLNGKVYIASFAFTSCPTTCPALMEKLQVIQKRVRGLGTSIGLVTFTVDPETDTPKVLHKQARKLHSNPYVWSFLTGDRADLRKIVVDGFKVPMGNKEEMTGKVDNEEVTMMDIAHTEKVVLVDQKGDIRGYYSTDKHSVNKLMIDVGLVINNSYKK